VDETNGSGRTTLLGLGVPVPVPVPVPLAPAIKDKEETQQVAYSASMGGPKTLNSLTAKCVTAGTNNSLSEDFLLAKHTSNKHLHHDEPFSPLAGMVLIPHPRELFWEGLDEAAIEGISIKL
jgi:hypothetical protein